MDQTNILHSFPSGDAVAERFNLRELKKQYEDVKLHSLDMLTKIEFMKKTATQMKD